MQAANPQTTLYPIGTLVKGRYRLIEELWRGPGGQVFKAQDEDLQRARSAERFIALKAFDAPGTSARASLQADFDAAKALTHDHIARLYDLDWDGATALVTMEYLEGGSTLSALIKGEYAHGAQIAAAWPIIAAAGGALAHAHERRVIHAHLGPDSVFITRGGVVKLLDFVCRATPAGTTTPYASLEQCTGQTATAQDDIYAFAVMTYEMLSGHHPFARVSAIEAAAAELVPKRLDGLRRGSWEALRNALAFRREARTQGMKPLLQALEPASFMRKYRMPLIGGACVAIAAALAVGSRQYADYLERETLRAAAHAPATRPAVRSGPVSPERRKEIDDSLFLAGDYLRDVNVSQAPDDLAYALSEGANNVNQILDSVLAVDAGNTSALKMKAQVAELYLKKARELSARRQLPGALTMTQYGLKVMPDNLDLFHLQREICDRQPPLCAAN
jgi:serine/threonine protein kinase